MKKIIPFFAAILLSACSSLKYTELTGYFVRNDAPEEIPLVIKTQQEFEKYFGYAAVMGPKGMPTEIDWDHQVVLTHVEPETNRQTEIKIDEVSHNSDGSYTLKTTTTQAETMSYTIRPFVLVTVKK